jgi:hypothetical protein
MTHSLFAEHLKRNLFVAARRLAPLSFKGFQTLRSARSDLSSRLESATGRSGAYSDRACICQNNASLRTHHASQYISNDFRREIGFLAMEISPNFVGRGLAGSSRCGPGMR